MPPHRKAEDENGEPTSRSRKAVSSGKDTADHCELFLFFDELLRTCFFS
jgi:hypothetical protein